MMIVKPFILFCLLATYNANAFTCSSGEYVSRFDSNRYLSEEEIVRLVQTLAEILKREMTDETRDFIDKAFKRAF